jgi:hypothetical protein
MSIEPIRGRTIRWTFTDGPMANRTFEHAFADDGTVTFKPIQAGSQAVPSHPVHYECEAIGDDVWAVSYLGDSGYTLSTILDYRTHELTAFASNERELALQHGTFSTIAA